jgi:hypothetical protein
MKNKRIRPWIVAVAICGILALVLIAFVFFISGGTGFGTVFIRFFLTAALRLGIIGVILAIAIVLIRKYKVGGKAPAWVIAAVICTIFPLVLIDFVLFTFRGTDLGTALIGLLLFVAALAIIGVITTVIVKRKRQVKAETLTVQKKRNYAVAAFICFILAFVLPSVFPMMILLGFPALLITSIVLVIIAIMKRESRGEGLAIGAFYLSSFAFVHIIYFFYFLLSGLLFSKKPDFIGGMVLLNLPFISLPLGIIAILLAIAAIRIREHQLKYRTLAIMAILIVILEIVPGLWSFEPEWREQTRKASCGPFVYSFDGTEFVLDSEPYAGAILIERTGYSELNRLAVVDGRYQLKITNELNETQYTDELKLLVVEHPVGTDIVSDVTGRIHTIASPVAPIFASEPPGTDILGLVSEKDNRFWEGGISDKSFRIGFGECKEVILEFPKPQYAKRAKLVMNVSNTLWSSSVASEFLQSFGNSYPAMSAVRSWARKGFIRFEVQAWEKGKWTTKGWIRGASPHLPKDQVLVLDVSPIAGESLKLRLTPAAGFWRINSAIVDYGDDVPMKATELEAVEAVNHKGQDIRQVLRADDDNFYVTQNGDHAIITFDEPPPVPNMARSFVLKATGYYKIQPSD